MRNEPLTLPPDYPTALTRFSWALGVIFLCVLAGVGMISVQMGEWPWEFHWLDGNKPDSLVVALVGELRMPLAAISIFGIFVGARLLLKPEDDYRYRNNVEDDLGAVDANPAQYARSISASVKADGVDVLLMPSSNNNSSEVAEMKMVIERLELKNKQLTDQIASSEVAKSSFLSTISHELRTPMNGIVGMTELLQASEMPGREKEYVSTIQSSAESLMHSLGDILDYTRLSSGELQLEKSQFQLQECVEDVCEAHAATAHTREVELVCDIEADVPLMVEGDHNRIRQILNHLVGNAISFTHDGEVVVTVKSIKSRAKLHTLQFDVRDTGSGIAPEMQMRMFDAFSQEDESITRSHEGLGLGLAVSRKLVAAMNGTMEFRSRLGEGTTFTFTLDLIEVPMEHSELQKPMLNGSRVLLVDDNDTNRTILKHQLTQWGVISVSAASGDEALEVIQQAVASDELFDAMILDMHMPKMDGLTLARKIDSNPDLPKIRTMLLTSAHIEESSEELAKIGIEKFISKPARQSLLHSSLASLMPYSRARKKIVSEATPVFDPIDASVLVVEDNVLNQNVTSELLQSFGCRVDAVDNGRDAVDRCANNHYDVVYMDCELPTMSGFEATAAIRALPGKLSSVVIVAITANAMEGDSESCLQSGMDDYLSKPLHQEALYDTLLRWCVTREQNVVVPLSDEVSSEQQRAAESTQSLVEIVPDSSLNSDSKSDSIVTAPEDAVSGHGELLNIAALESIESLQRPGKEDLLGKVVDIYFEKSPSLIRDIHRIKDGGESAAASAAAHALKSSSAYLGAEQLANHCARIEHAVKAGDSSKVIALAEGIPEFYEALSVELMHYMSQRKKAA